MNAAPAHMGRLGQTLPSLVEPRSGVDTVARSGGPQTGHHFTNPAAVSHSSLSGGGRRGLLSSQVLQSAPFLHRRRGGFVGGV